MKAARGQNEAPHNLEPSRRRRGVYDRAIVCSGSVWGFVMSLARHPVTRVVVLILLMMFQMLLLWLLGQMVDLCLSLMEVWLQLARKHLELTI